MLAAGSRSQLSPGLLQPLVRSLGLFLLPSVATTLFSCSYSFPDMRPLDCQRPCIPRLKRGVPVALASILFLLAGVTRPAPAIACLVAVNGIMGRETAAPRLRARSPGP